MSSKESALDSFIDDCFIDEDPLCTINKERSLELVASQLIAELIAEEDDEIRAA